MPKTTKATAGTATKPPKATGLKVERVFTKPDVHPYDDVKWESRDVVMTNWRDGSINFEQRGVEFPEFWSQNATQIVTSKYFRGALGTPQREQSLKQVIDRVVTEYHKAGEKNGYFATAEDAQVFADELTWLLLHQYFSFNSPVWFNVGTAAPQQVSACQPYNALVNTPAGPIPIGKLVENGMVGTKVYDAEGVTRILAVKANGVKEVLRLHTKSGHQLDVTADHLVWKSTGEGTGRFVEAGTLASGDQLEWHRRYTDGEAEFFTSEMYEAALAGWLQADGFVGQYDEGTNRSLTIEAITVTEAEYAWVVKAIEAVFPGAHYKVREQVTQDESLECKRIRLYGEHLRPFVQKWGLLTRGAAMTVPERLYTASLPVVKAYLRSVFQAEGYVSSRERSTLVACDMVSEGLIRGMQELLQRFAIFSRVTRKRDAREDRQDLWSLGIQNDGDRGVFAVEIGFVCERKHEKLVAGFSKPGRAANGTKRLEIDHIEQLGPQEVYDIQTESGEYLSHNLRVHNCFILSVDDTMESILDWYKEEGMIFKGGSGAGVNLSKIRSSAELLSSGGSASGPISFMRGADASAGTIKSGGATRRAAKMVILDVDHPDIEAFIDTKAREEDKIRALRDAGFDVDLGGEDMFSVQYQNANNSVRVTDEFMKAVEQGTDYALKARTTGEELSRRDAREVLRRMAQAAWECADPGIQYDDIINDWHTNSNTDRIYASNPCFPADERVVTDKGLIKIGDLVRRATEGETFAVFTNDVTAEKDAADRVVATRPLRYMVTGTNEIVELRFSDGSRLRCTPNHRLWTKNRGWVHADQLQPNDQVVRSNQYAPRSAASTLIPRAALTAAEQTGSALRLPAKWDEEPELAHYMGWLVGDGCVTEQGVVTVYGSEEEQRDLLPRHQRMLERLTGHLSKPSVQANGTQQLRGLKSGFAEFFKELGFSNGRAAEKVFPEALHEADEETVVSFLQGLFDADGRAVELENGTRYVGLGSKSEELLLGVQETLGSLGIGARIYRTESKDATFQYTKKDGTEVEYASEGPFFDLRISGPSMVEFAALIGFGLESKSRKLASMLDFKTRYNTDRTVRLTSRESVGFETTYNLTEPRNHSYIVNGVVVANCSEYMSLNDSSCNLASLNLMKFLGEDGSFDVERFVATVEFVITAMEISISFADFPTEKIAETTRNFRQLGIGYSNLGALLMASGHAYDSEDGRALAAAITALMTGVSYRRSAEIAGVVGPYAGYGVNAEPHQRVMRKHAAAAEQVQTFGDVDATVLDAAKAEWARGNEIGAVNGWRNAQASVLAPTGCLTGDTLITTDRGLTRLESLGDPFGGKWQDLDATVSTDEGPKQATKFFVNGEEPTRRITTEAGYRIQGTLVHRVKVIDEVTGQWEWKRLADIQPGDLVPMQLRQLVGEPNRVPLPVLDQAYYTEDGELTVPDSMSEELAELVGYFMGDGSLHAKGIRLCVAEDDQDVVNHLSRLSEKLFNLTPQLAEREGYIEVTLQSVRLARWWQAAGFAKGRPSEDHGGKGRKPRIPAAVLETNAESVYEAFVRGLFEADGTVLEGVPSVCTCTPEFADEIRTLLLVLGFATTTRTTPTGWGGDASVVRIRNIDHALNFAERIGFIGNRKNELQAWEESERSAKRDRVYLPRAAWDDIVPVGHPYRNRIAQSLRKHGGVARQTAADLYAHTRDERLRFALGYLFERVQANEDGGVVPTYDLSVPENVTYVANGMVSHNTISFMMDCDTTGIEPDLALVKHKKLVGGGSMEIVNQTVPRALANLGYDEDERQAIVDYIADHGHVVGAPHLAEEHYSVFDCAMGERSISPMGHVHMMAAVQPFLSGSVSKTVNLPETATVEDIEEVYFQGWKLGLKALAVYRDNCKVGQPLSAKKKEIDKAVEAAVEEVVATVASHGPVRRKLPKKRPSQTISFTVGGAEGYMTSSSYPDDGLGEVFLKMSKQGSTLAGVMDALSVSISIALQYGVPLEKYVEKFTNMRFEPAGMTDDPDIRMASSLVDYIFRRLALDYLPYEERAALGILTTAERTAELNGEDPSKVHQPEVDLDALRTSAPIEESSAAEDAGIAEAVTERVQIETKKSRQDILNSAQARSADAPLCMNCGTKMRPAGSCYACEGCGATSGCS